MMMNDGDLRKSSIGPEFKRHVDRSARDMLDTEQIIVCII